LRLPVRRNMCGGHCSLAPDIVIFPMPVENAPMKNWIPLAIAALFAVVIGLLALQGADLRREVSSGKVLDTTRVVHEQFMAMVAPIDRDLRLVAEWGRSGVLEMGDARRLSAKLMPLLESLPLVSGLMLTDTDGQEFFLLHAGADWYLRRAGAYRAGMEAAIERLRADGTPRESRLESRTFDPRTRPWFAGALQAAAPAALFWTAPYRFHTLDKLGITAAIRWEDRQNGLLHVAAMDMLLDDLLDFLRRLNVSPNARILLIRKDGALLATGAGAAEAAFALPGALTDPLLGDILKVWSANRSTLPVAVPFRQDNAAWWAGFQPLLPGAANTWIGVAVPEADLAGNLRQAWIRTILLAVLLLACGAALISLLLRRFGPRRTHSGLAPQTSGGTPEALRVLIAGGENPTLEFKSTLRTNLKTGQADKAIELAWLKSIVAFMNSAGGKLLIGVSDEGRVVGIEADGFDNPDKILLHVKNLVNQHIGVEFSPYVQCRLHQLDNRTVVAVSCARAQEPVFLVMGKNEDFYIRSGPSSIRLPMSKMVRYLKQRK
jgi:hypothetical protein